ncbi:MAG: hypothetical protein CTY39_03580 [Hyphomicrobium sp.]|nr:MAG: hypothetical protein CTY39_03580 [Hyphomicrobium sp.]
MAVRECPASSDAMWTLSLLTASLGDVWNVTSGQSYILDSLLRHLADDQPGPKYERIQGY